MSGGNSTDSSTSESEISACSSKYNPLKVLYSKQAKAPIQNAPLFENIDQYEAALKYNHIFPVGESDAVRKREEEKKRKKREEEQRIEERNKARFAQYQDVMPTRTPRNVRNVLTRIDAMSGPLATLKDCVDHRLRIKVITRNDKGIRGVLHATLVAFDKQWNLALSDVLEIWKRKGVKKRKIPPALGIPVQQGTAANISRVPVVTETPIGGGVWECARHIPQLMMRGEHVVLINVVER